MFYILAALLVLLLIVFKPTQLYGIILLVVLCMVYPRIFIGLIVLIGIYLYLRLG
jgi:hypothetical protein